MSLMLKNILWRVLLMYHKDRRFRRVARRNEIKRKKKILKHHWCNDNYLNSDKFIEVIDKNIEYKNERKKKSLNDCEGDCDICRKCCSN